MRGKRTGFTGPGSIKGDFMGWFDDEKFKEDWGFLIPETGKVAGYEEKYLTPTPVRSYSSQTAIAPRTNDDLIAEKVRSYLMPGEAQPNKYSLLDDSAMSVEPSATPAPRAVAATNPVREKVVRAIKEKYQLPQEPLFNEEALLRAEEQGDDQRLSAGLGMGIQQIIGAIGNVEPNTKYQEAQLAGADKRLDRETRKQEKVKEYLLNKMRFEKELEALKSDEAYKKGMLDINRGELALKGKKMATELPDETKAAATNISTSVANKVTISDQIDSKADTMEKQLQAGDKDGALQTAKEMIKVLNSTEGKDAVGAEESNRLAGKLKFAMGNFFSDDPMRFGRDLEGFLSDARNNSNTVKDAAGKLKEKFKAMTGREHPLPISPKYQTKAEQATSADRELGSGAPPGATMRRKRADGTWEYK